MTIAVCTIQRDRARWIPEWVAFHGLVGVSKFYIYLHRCRDDSEQVVQRLAQRFDIEVFVVPEHLERPQLKAYQHCYQANSALYDWIAFIDGDEFLFSPLGLSIQGQLDKFWNQPLGALAVYWACFGSSGHQQEPEGLITDNYRFRADQNFPANSHIKSIVRGGQGDKFAVLNTAHFFRASGGTFDTSMREVNHGFMEGFEPCWDSLRINHYVTQSRRYFKDFKQASGMPDSGSNLERSEEWWREYDRNEVPDDSLVHIHEYLREAMKTLNNNS